MFLIIELKDNIKGYINLGSDLSKAQDLLNMVENNLVFVKDNYNGFEKFVGKCSVEVTKEITLDKTNTYSETFDVVHIGEDIDKSFIGTLSEPIECEHNIKAVQEHYMKRIEALKKEISNTKATIQHLENTIETLTAESDWQTSYKGVSLFYQVNIDTPTANKR